MPVNIAQTYTFVITGPDGIPWTAQPSNASLKWKWEKLERWGFWQKVLDTDLIFVNSPDGSIKDFDKFLAIEERDLRCQFIDVEVFRACGPINVPFWTGRIRCSDGDWNKSLCRLKIKPEPVNAYTCLTEVWEEELNFAGGVTPITVNVRPKYVTETKVCKWTQKFNTFIWLLLDAIEGTNNSGFSYGNQFLQNVRDSCVEFAKIKCSELNDAGGDAWVFLDVKVKKRKKRRYEVTVRVVRERATITPCGVPDSDPAWILLEDNCPTSSTYVRPSQVVYLPTVQSDPDYAGYNVETSLNGIVFDFPVHNAYGLGDVLQWYTSQAQLGCTLPIISNFFNINPDNTNPVNKAYLAAATNLANVKIVHVSDFVKDDADGPDSNASVKYSLKSILENMPGNIDIAIDNGTLRIEHVSYFRRNKMLDLTQAGFVERNAGKYHYKYDKTKLPKSEKFAWISETDKSGGDFDGLPIKYTGACIARDSKDTTISFEIFISNIKYILENKPDFADALDGLILLATDGDVVLYETGILSNDIKLNGHFAIANLQENYYKWDRPLSTGIMNNQPTEFFRWMKQKRQEDIKVQLCCEDITTFDPNDLVKTQLGWGEVDDVQFDDPTSTLKLNLSFH